MAEEKIYVVVACYGSFDSYTEEVEKTFKNKADAEKYIKDHENKNIKYKCVETTLK